MYTTIDFWDPQASTVVLCSQNLDFSLMTSTLWEGDDDGGRVKCNKAMKSKCCVFLDNR